MFAKGGASFVLTTCSVETSVATVISVHDYPSPFGNPGQRQKYQKEASSNREESAGYYSSNFADGNVNLPALGNATMLHSTAQSRHLNGTGDDGIISNDESYDSTCPMLFFRASSARSYFVVVSALSPSDEGNFHLSAVCDESAPSLSPSHSQAPTLTPSEFVRRRDRSTLLPSMSATPSSSPTVAVTHEVPFNVSLCRNHADMVCPVDGWIREGDAMHCTQAPTLQPTAGSKRIQNHNATDPPCAFRHLTCGDAFRDSNVGGSDEIGNPNSGDVFYLISGFMDIQNFTITVCSRSRGLFIQMAAHLEYPSANTSSPSSSSVLTRAGANATQSCAVVHLSNLPVGSVWLHVEGSEQGKKMEGAYDVTVECGMSSQPTPSAQPTPAFDVPCTYDVLTCDESTGLTSTWGLSDVAGDAGGDALFVLSIWIPQRVTLTTCGGAPLSGNSSSNGANSEGIVGFSSVIRVYDEWPGHRHGGYSADASTKAPTDIPRPLHPVSYRQNPRNRSCAILVAELLIGSYWVTVEGGDTSEFGPYVNGSALDLGSEYYSYGDSAGFCFVGQENHGGVYAGSDYGDEIDDGAGDFSCGAFDALEGTFNLDVLCSPHSILNPTPAPTSLPSPPPSPLPTPVPSVYECVPDLQRIQPAIHHTGLRFGDLYALGDENSWGAGKFSRDFGMLFASTPGSSFTFAAIVSGVSVAIGAGGSSAKDSAEGGRLRLVIKESIVYHDDRNFELSYQVTDRWGRTQVLSSSLTVVMVLVTAAGSTSTTTCSLPGSTTGSNDCFKTIPTSWFSTTSDVTVTATVSLRYDDIAVLVDAASFTLEQEPIFNALSGAGMEATVPHHKLLGNEKYQMAITANTGGEALSVWVIQVAYDTSVLTYTSTSTSNSYTSAVIVASMGGLSLSTSGLANGIDTDDVTGEAISVVIITFRIKNGASAGDHAGALSFVVAQMVNQFSIAFADDLAGQVNDARGGAQMSATVSVDSLEYTGLFAYAAQNELVNTAVLDGSAVTSSISGLAVHNNAAKSNMGVSSSQLSCSINPDDEVFLGLNGCTVKLLSTHDGGKARVPVTVVYGDDLEATVYFKVWFPEAVTVSISDSKLGTVVGSSEGSIVSPIAACDGYDGGFGRTQSGKLMAMATFTSDGENATIHGADVTGLVSFASSEVSVLAIESNHGGVPMAKGLRNGSALVSLALPSGDHPSIDVGAALEVFVGRRGDEVSLYRLHVVAYSGASFTSSHSGAQLTPTAGQESTVAVEPRLQFELKLKSEGATAEVVAYAEYTDGTIEDVTAEIRLKSLAEESLTITSNRTVEVAVGASSLCGNVLRAVWPVCPGLFSTGRGVVMLEMPAATGVTIMRSSSKLTRSGNGATANPFHVATSVTITVKLDFEDGTNQDYSEDRRTHYTVEQSGGSHRLVELHSTNQVRVHTLPSEVDLSSVDDNYVGTDDDSPVVVIFVSFPDVHTLNGTITMVVVELTALETRTLTYPDESSWYNANGDVTTLRQVACSGVWQRLQGWAKGTLSDGTTSSTFSFYKQVEWIITDDSGVGAVLSAPCTSGRCRGVSVPDGDGGGGGSFTLTGTFYGKSASISVAVDAATPVDVADVQIYNNLGSSQTMGGAVGFSDTMSVLVTFDDGTKFDVANAGETSSAWLSPSQLLTFASDNTAALTVSDEGIVALVSNYHDSVVIAAADKCGSGKSGTQAEYANLYPEVYDIDLGATVKAPLGFVGVGDDIDVDVRIRASSSYALTVFQITVTFDATIVQVAADGDCRQGGDWSSSWSCTVNDPPDEVRLIGSCGLFPSSMCGTKNLLDVAKVTFQAVAAGATTFSVNIVKLGDDSATVEGTTAFAGTVTLVVESRRRLSQHTNSGDIDVDDNKREGEGHGSEEAYSRDDNYAWKYLTTTPPSWAPQALCSHAQETTDPPLAPSLAVSSWPAWDLVIEANNSRAGATPLADEVREVGVYRPINLQPKQWLFYEWSDVSSGNGTTSVAATAETNFLALRAALYPRLSIPLSAPWPPWWATLSEAPYDDTLHGFLICDDDETTTPAFDDLEVRQENELLRRAVAARDAFWKSGGGRRHRTEVQRRRRLIFSKGAAATWNASSVGNASAFATRENASSFVRLKLDGYTRRRTAEAVVVRPPEDLRLRLGGHAKSLDDENGNCNGDGRVVDKLARRRKLDGFGTVLGDTNGDGVCDVSDVQYLQFFVGGSIDASSLTDDQLVAMDPDKDGDSDGVDISYLLSVVAGKYRFISAFTFSAPLYLSVSLCDVASAPAAADKADLYYEVGTMLNPRTPFHIGQGLDGDGLGAQTSDGVYVQGVESDSNPGEYEAAGTPLFNEASAGVVVMVETKDSLGNSNNDRKFAFYCTRLYSPCVSVYGNKADAFRPFSTVDMTGDGTPDPTPFPSSPYPSLPPSSVPTQCDNGPTGFGNYLLKEGQVWGNQTHCAFQHLTCGDIQVGNNKDAPDELGHGASGDIFFMISIFGTRKSVAVTSCRPSTVIGVYLGLYDGFPVKTDDNPELDRVSNSSPLFESDSYERCAVVIAELDPGTYWLHVEGNKTVVNGTEVSIKFIFLLI